MRRKRPKRRHGKRRRNGPVPAIKTSLYERLPSQTSIRLITLQPGYFSDPVRCKLEVFELASVPFYEAISYVWGDPTARNRIRCNERRYLIGDNLYDALRNVRLEDEPRVIWVDALCINQANLGERSHQILLMRNIYSQAQRTLICLDIKPCIDTLEEDWTTTSYEAILMIAVWSERNSFPPTWSPVDDRISKFPPLESKQRVALVRLFSCKWFHRVWVIQEAILSRESGFIVNRKLWRWYPLGIASCRLSERIGGMKEMDISIFPGLTQAAQTWTSFVRKKNGIVHTLLDNMINFWSALATDPKDMIYGLLGVSQEQSLLEQQMKTDIKCSIPLPNYEDSLINVFADWGRYFIESSGDLEIFSLTLLCGEGAPDALDFKPLSYHKNLDVAGWTAEDTRYPSWVPRWNRLYCGHLCYNSNSNINLEYRASSNLRSKTKTSPRRDSITLSGVVFDIVSWTGNVMYSTVPEAPLIFCNFHAIYKKLALYPSGDTVDTAYAIAAAAGHVQHKPTEDSSTPGEDMLAYLSWYVLAQDKASDSAEGPDKDKENPGWSASYVKLIGRKCRYRRFFITEKGYIGIGPGPVKRGDQICVLFGGKTPFILRKIEDHFRLIGESYIHGIMNGEVIQQLEAGELEEQWFDIR